MALWLTALANARGKSASAWRSARRREASTVSLLARDSGSHWRASSWGRRSVWHSRACLRRNSLASARPMLLRLPLSGCLWPLSLCSRATSPPAAPCASIRWSRCATNRIVEWLGKSNGQIFGKSLVKELIADLILARGHFTDYLGGFNGSTQH